MDTEFLKTLAALALGWLLGLLAPQITEAIKRRRDNESGRRAILAELHDVSFKIFTAAYAVELYNGNLSRKLLDQYRKSSDNFEKTEDVERFTGILDRLLADSDKSISGYAKYAKSQAGSGAVLQKYKVPLLDSRVSALWSFETGFTRKLLDIRVGMDLLNDIVDRSYKFADMTFQELSEVNRNAIEKNIDICYENYRARALQVVEQIAALKLASKEA